MKFKYIRHKSPEDIWAEHWGVDPSELEGSTVGFSNLEDGRKVSPLSNDVLMETLREMGVWGYAEPSSGEVHFWADDSTSDEKILYFLGHEIGHLSGKPFKADHLEEQRAELFAAVTQEAFEALKMIRSTK